MHLGPAELLTELDYGPGFKFPKSAIQEIVSRREEMTPILLDVLESCRVNPEDFNGSSRCMQATYAAYTLAQFQETRAYRPIIALLELDPGITGDIFGDSLTEDLKDILTCVFDGDETPLRGLIENPQANEWARASSGLGAYPALMHSGKIARPAVEQYFGELMEKRLEREPAVVWDNLTTISGDLGFSSLLPLIRRGYDEGLCDPGFDSLESIEERLQAGGDPAWAEDCEPIDDVVSLMKGWACFNLSPARPGPKPDPLASMLHENSRGLLEFSSPPVTPPQPLFRGVGRNDPCPCGSGRKFKKCCGAA